MNEPYHSISDFLKNKFNKRKVLKIPINAGFHCPNKDGSLSDQGCIFCDQWGSGPLATYHLPISEQIEAFITKHPGKKYLAYFQSHTNTYAIAKELEKTYQIVFDYPDIVGLSIGTRPDTIAPDVFELLKKINKKIYLMIELGLQSIHPKSLEFLNRNHTYDQFLDTFLILKKLEIDVVVHLIIGIPGESQKDMLATIFEMNRIRPMGIKFHQLHILKNTQLHKLYSEKKIQLLQEKEYINLIILLLENLDPSIVVHRLTAEREQEIWCAPEWAKNKMDILNSIMSQMRTRHTYQGKKIRI